MVKVRENLTGRIFGRWRVIEQTDDYIIPSNGKPIARWLCECSCEEHTVRKITGAALRSGESLSCGCLAREMMSEKYLKDLTGQIFGRLTVIKLVGKDKFGEALWLCRCSCQDQKEIVVRGSSLRKGQTQSCGCLQKERAVEANKKYNLFNLDGEYGIGWTSNTGAEFYFDLEDYDKIKDYCWYESKQRQMSQLMAHIPGQNKPIRMHVWLGFKNYDHIDRNELNNRKSNLRPATVKENSRNGSLRNTNTSGIIGVGWYKERNKWYAQITVNYKNLHLGYFENKEDAIRVRLNAEVKYFGEFAPQRHLYAQYGIETQQND